MPADDVAYGMRDSVLLGLEKLALDEVSTPTDSCPWLPSGTVSVVEAPPVGAPTSTVHSLLAAEPTDPGVNGT